MSEKNELELENEILNTGLDQKIKDIISLQNFSKQVAKKDFLLNTHSPQINEISKAMIEFKKNMPEMKTDKAAGGRYRYQSLPALLSIISPILAKFGCFCIQPIHSIGEKTFVITMIIHSSGQYFKSVTSVPEKHLMAGKLTNTNENLQAMGSALTYTKRHALKSLLCIDADDDTDGNDTPFRNGSTFKPNYSLKNGDE